MRRRPTEYAMRLSEKQKVLFHYNIREKQFRRFIKDAKEMLLTGLIVYSHYLRLV